MRVGRQHGALVGAAGDGGGRREQPDPAGSAARDRELGGRSDDADHVERAAASLHVLLERPERSRAGGVARDDQQLRAGSEEMLGDLDREATQLLERPIAVGKARRVAEIDVVLGRAARRAARAER